MDRDSTPRPLLTAIVPFFNEKDLLQECVEKTWSWFTRREIPFELILVDDGSDDGSRSIARRLEAGHPGIALVENDRNRGVGRALSLALERARGEFAFLHCVDMPLKLDDLDRVIPLLDAGCDVLVASRHDRSAHSVPRKITSWVNYVLIRLLFRLPLGDFQFVQFYRTDRIRRFLPLISSGSFGPPELIIKSWRARLAFRGISLPFHRRTAGKAKYGSPGRLIQAIVEIISFRLSLLRGEGTPRRAGRLACK